MTNGESDPESRVFTDGYEADYTFVQRVAPVPLALLGANGLPLVAAPRDERSDAAEHDVWGNHVPPHQWRCVGSSKHLLVVLGT